MCPKPRGDSCTHLERFASALWFLQADRRLIVMVSSEPVEFCCRKFALEPFWARAGRQDTGSLGVLLCSASRERNQPFPEGGA